MTLLIACILIYGLHLDPHLYYAAFIVWFLHLGFMARCAMWKEKTPNQKG